jgi:hypothetical protein
LSHARQGLGVPVGGCSQGGPILASCVTCGSEQDLATIVKLPSDHSLSDRQSMMLVFVGTVL